MFSGVTNGRNGTTFDNEPVIEHLDKDVHVPYWAVHVALVEAGRPVAGAVALPAQRVVLVSAPPPPLAPDPPERPRVIVSRSRPPAVASHLAEVLGGDLVTMGSAGAKASAVILGAADVYAHSGGQYEWDSCAPVAVAFGSGPPCHTPRRHPSHVQPPRPVPPRPAHLSPEPGRSCPRGRGASFRDAERSPKLSRWVRGGSAGSTRNTITAMSSLPPSCQSLTARSMCVGQRLGIPGAVGR